MQIREEIQEQSPEKETIRGNTIEVKDEKVEKEKTEIDEKFITEP